MGKKRHNFPNLACMKLSAYHKHSGHSTKLITDYGQIEQYDKIYVSKVFTETEVPDKILSLSNVEYGGTGFFYDKAPKLPDEIEHIMPDYDLYNGIRDTKYYTDYSIGFLTRGCFRRCDFCVNRNSRKVELHSPLEEFLDTSRKKICLLDDNFLGCPKWRKMLERLQETGKPFQFKQGLDIRLLTDESAEVLFRSKYDGDYIFAFDDANDSALIESKLKLLRKYTNAVPKFYVFCGFDRNGKWGLDFWKQDLWDVWRRVDLLTSYHCLPYIMRYERYVESPYDGTYVNLARWCNQPSFFKKLSYREFCEESQKYVTKECSSMRYLKQLEKEMPELASKYYDLRW